MKAIILDDLRPCKDPDCANPILLDRALDGEVLSKRDKSRLSFFLDECKECKEYFLKGLQKKEIKK